MNVRSLFKRIENRALHWINVDRDLPLQIDITNLCNLRCTHCYHPHHRNEGALSLSQWQEILDQYDEMVKKFRFRPKLIICGGEPLLSPLLNPILEHVQSYQTSYHLSILTNGTLVNHLDLELLRKFEGVTFQVSLDGPSAASHDRVRGKGSFIRSINGIRELKQLGFSVELLSVLSHHSSARIAEFFDLARGLEVDRMGFTRLIVNGHAARLVASGTDRTLAPNELRDAYAAILAESLRTGIKTGARAPLMHLVHPKLGMSPRMAEGVIVDYRGKMLASSRSRLELGDVLESGMESLHLNHPIKKALRRGQIDVCGNCRFYRYCGGDRNAAFAATGNFLGPDPGCWIQQKNKIKVMGT